MAVRFVSPATVGLLTALALSVLGLFASTALADGVISGTVTDASTQAGVSGITVDLFDADYNFVA
jgi:hypothetical protein